MTNERTEKSIRNAVQHNATTSKATRHFRGPQFSFLFFLDKNKFQMMLHQETNLEIIATISTALPFFFLNRKPLPS